MHKDPNHPSQAEGEDPERPGSGSAEPEQGHPSQAEGDDPESGDESTSR